MVLRNFEGTITTYQEPDKYEAQFCNRRCDQCNLELQLEDGQEVDATGIEKLLCDYDETISLTPSESDRMERRDDN